jgi:hypothetical protein
LTYTFAAVVAAVAALAAICAAVFDTVVFAAEAAEETALVTVVVAPLIELTAELAADETLWSALEIERRMPWSTTVAGRFALCVAAFALDTNGTATMPVASVNVRTVAAKLIFPPRGGHGSRYE